MLVPSRTLILLFYFNRFFDLKTEHKSILPEQIQELFNHPRNIAITRYKDSIQFIVSVCLKRGVIWFWREKWIFEIIHF